jgi:hypothetical protein
MSQDERDEVLPDEAILQTSDAVMGEEEYSPFDEIREDFKPSALKRTMGADGLPVTHAPDTKNDIPPLSPETLVCMADTSKFVIRNGWGDITAEYPPEEVKQSPSGQYFVEDGGERKRVVPLRPACQHYVRQMMGFELNANHVTVYRLCGARRTTEGTFMTVRDCKVSACTMREPRDLTSEALIETFDAKKVEQGKEREFTSIFSKV